MSRMPSEIAFPTVRWQQLRPAAAKPQQNIHERDDASVVLPDMQDPVMWTRRQQERTVSHVTDDRLSRELLTRQ